MMTKRLDGTSSHMSMLSLIGGSVEVSLLTSLAAGGSGRAGVGAAGIGLIGAGRGTATTSTGAGVDAATGTGTTVVVVPGADVLTTGRAALVSMRGAKAGTGASWTLGASVASIAAPGDSVFSGARFAHQPASTSTAVITNAGSSHVASARGRDVGVGGNSIATSGA